MRKSNEEMMDDVIRKYGTESKEAIDFCTMIEKKPWRWTVNEIFYIEYMLGTY